MPIFTVLPAPVIVTLAVPAVNTEPAPEESQLPETVADPLVNESVVPEPTVTSPTVKEDEDAVIPPVPASETLAPPVMLFPEVVRVPDPAVDRLLLTSMADDCEIVPLIARL
jgi:hypothetical protein